MFPPAYFAKRYFPARFFPPNSEIVLLPEIKAAFAKLITPVRYLVTRIQPVTYRAKRVKPEYDAGEIQ